MRTYILICIGLIAITLIGSACSEDPQPNTPVGVTQASPPTATSDEPTPEDSPTASPLVQATSNTAERPTPTYPVDRSGFTTSTVNKGAWQTAPFIAVNGESLSFSDFMDEGQVIVIHLFSTQSMLGSDQTRDLAIVSERLAITNNANTVTFISISVDGSDTLQSVDSYILDYGETMGNVQWIAGVATQDLLQAIAGTFNLEVLDPNAGGLIFIDKSGFGHLSDGVPVLPERLTDVIIHFIGGEGVDAPIADEEIGTDIAPEERVTEPPTQEPATATPTQEPTLTN